MLDTNTNFMYHISYVLNFRIANLPRLFFLAITLAGLHVLPATSKLQAGSRVLRPDYRVVLLRDLQPCRLPLAYGNRVRPPIFDDLILFYQRYQVLPFFKAVHLTSALQICGCHFITSHKMKCEYIRLFSTFDAFRFC